MNNLMTRVVFMSLTVVAHHEWPWDAAPWCSFGRVRAMKLRSNYDYGNSEFFGNANTNR
jgi:hypothetical protein